MKTVKSKTILLVITMMLVLSLTVGLTLAYFSDHTAAEGGSALVLGGSTEVREKTGENSKSVWIENTGETNVVVRVAIYGPTGMEITANSNWEFKDGFYYYKGILKPGDTTPQGSLEAKVTVPGGDLGDEYQIVVIQECAQATYELNAGGENVVAAPEAWGYIPAIKA